MNRLFWISHAQQRETVYLTRVRPVSPFQNESLRFDSSWNCILLQRRAVFGLHHNRTTLLKFVRLLRRGS